MKTSDKLRRIINRKNSWGHSVAPHGLKAILKEVEDLEKRVNPVDWSAELEPGPYDQLAEIIMRRMDEKRKELAELGLKRDESQRD